MEPSSTPLRWGFIATGGIADQAARDLALVDGATLHAVSSRALARAEAFAGEHGADRAYGSHLELLADPDVDAVYVATPHAQHHMVVSDAIAAGKPVLVEKAFTCTFRAAEDLVRRARAAGVFMMEAMWVRFQPGIAAMRAMIAEGVIGEIRSVHADLGFVNDRDLPRLIDPAAGGGVVLDCGVYLVSFAQWLLGAPTTVHASGVLGPTGVDVEAGLLLGFPDGAHAVLSCSFTSDSPGRLTIVGTAGHIVVEPRFQHSPAIRIARRGEHVEIVHNPLTGTGLAHEFEHVAACVRDGLPESPVMPLDDTLQVMAVLDTACDQLGTPHVDQGFDPTGSA